MNYSIKPVTKGVSLYAITPAWDHTSQRVIFSDIFAGTVSIYSPSTGQDEAKVVEKRAGSEQGKLIVSAVPMGDGGKLLVSMEDRRLLEYDFEAGQVSRELHPPMWENKNKATNDGKVDAKGRLWIGTQTWESYSPPQPVAGAGELICIQNKASGDKMAEGEMEVAWSVKQDGFDVLNCFSWNREGSKMYCGDYWKKVIDVFDFDMENGVLSNRKRLFDFGVHKELEKTHPGGLEVDMDGNVWLAVYLGGKAIKIDGVSGEMMEKIEIPVRTTTSLCFGGPQLETMYVTTASVQLDGSPVEQEGAGKLWEISGGSGFKGVPHPSFGNSPM